MRDAPRVRIFTNGVRIGALLALIALVPLGGAAWFAADQYRAASTARAEVDTVDQAADRLIKLTELRTRILDELNWSTAILGLEVVGISPAVAGQLSSIDIEGRYIESQRTVDSLVAELELSDVEAELVDVRSAMSDVEEMDRLTFGFQRLEQTVIDLANSEFDELTGIAASVDDGEELMISLRILDAAGEARHALTAQLIDYFSAQFSELIDFDFTLEALIVQRSSFLAASAEMDRLTPSGSATSQIRDLIVAEGDTAEFGAAVDQRIEGQLSVLSPQAEPDLSELIGQIDEIARIFNVGSAGAERHLDLVEAAGTDVTAAAQALESSAASEQASAQLIIIALVAISAVLGRVVTASIARPLRELEHTTKELQQGGGARTTEPRGPLEVRRAAQAINDAGAHLRLAERQATALADGDLEHPSLAQNAPGTLGESLQNAVRTLTMSLNEREEYRRQLAHDAAHDTLTQLPNRRASLARLSEGMARSSRTSNRLAVLFLDLDGFKDVNDHHGHQAGDVVLQVIAQRLLDGVRDGDHVGRLGGDEFLVIAEPVGGVDDAILLGERLLASISAPIETPDAVVAVNASIGIALPGESGLTADEILRDADLAVYKAKGEGKGRIELCDDSLREQVAHHSTLEAALRKAIDHDQFELDYQPITDAVTGDLVSVEALVRWRRPGHGRLEPADFLPFAERSELITEIDRWVLRCAARQLAAWTDHPRLGRVPVALNVSARHLSTDTFVPFVLTTLRDFGVDPARVVVEVTESAVLSDLRGAAVKLEELRAAGVRVAIDDFGTGYTSLAHLKTLPIDILKIDRSFTNDPNSRSLVKLIIDTGHLLGASVTAEGVESDAVGEDLAALGSDELQGFLYGHPVDPQALEAFGTSRSGGATSSS